MFFRIRHKEMYSRGELLLRSFFGLFYIAIPHLFLLLFLAIWNSILNFINFWIILFTGKYHESFFDFQLKFLKWINFNCIYFRHKFVANIGMDVADTNKQQLNSNKGN